MPKYVIEREIPGIGNKSGEELSAVAKNSRRVLEQLGPGIQWVESFITENKVYCIYIADNEDIIREHSKLAGVPVHNIAKIKTMMDPTTAEGL